MQSPKLSIIVPIYNVEKYLDRCMQSLLGQTLKEIEIILVDDGSPDRCPQMCDEYARMDDRVKVIHKENAGLGYARNSGLDIAQGEYIAFVDSDDYIERSMYEDLYREAVKSDADVVFAGFKTETQPGIWKDSNEVSQRTEWNGEGVKEFMLDMIACAPHVKQERKYQMSVWHSIYRTSIIREKNLRFLSERDVASEDLPFQVDFLQCTKKVVYLPKSYYYYCLNGTSLTASFKPEKFVGYKSLYKLLIEKVGSGKLQQERVDRFFIGYSRSHLTHLIQSQISNKRKWLKDNLDDDIWFILSSRYSPSKLSVYPRIFYYLTIKKHSILLECYIKIITIMKQLTNRRA